MNRAWLNNVLPMLSWLPNYSRDTLRSDASAGLTTAVMLIPQGMAYALLAGLPPIMGLYAATIPPLIYAVFGTSRQLAVGPMAMASLMVAVGIRELVPADQMTEENVVAAAILLTVVAGLFQVLLGLLRLGGLVELLSHPVVTGFTAAAALVIGASQLQHVVGFAVPGDLGVFATLHYVATHRSSAEVPSILLTVAAIATLIGLRRYAPKLPSALVVVVSGIVLSWLVDLEGIGVAVLGTIPSGLPTPSMPSITLEQVEAAAPLGLTVALIGFMESISAGRTYARKNHYDIRPTQELGALGLSNLAAAVFGGYTVGGALSRTAVNDEAGAKTPLANVFTAAAIALTLALFTPLFYFLPKPILAAIILVAVVKLLDVGEVVHLWKVKRDDLVLLGITFLATLFGTLEMGILTGVLASLLWLVYTSTRPEIATLGRVEFTRSYRSIEHFPDAETHDRVLILRMDAQFFFGNVAYLKETLFDRVDAMDDPVALVLDASSMNALDSTAADTWSEIIVELRARHVEIFISHLKGSVYRVMERTHLTELLGDGHIYYEVDDAVDAALRHRRCVEEGLPLEAEEFGPSDVMD